MSAENYPPSISQSLPVGYTIVETGINYIVNAGNTNTFLLRNADQSQKYIILPAGVWTISAFLTINYTNGVYTIPKLLVLSQLYELDNTPIDYYGSVACATSLAVLANTPPIIQSYSSTISCNKPVKVSLTIQAVSTVSPTTVNAISVYCQYMGGSVIDNTTI
jgi:hypothetical protein